MYIIINWYIIISCIQSYGRCNHCFNGRFFLEFDVAGLEKNLLSLEGVIDVHDIHVWSLSIGKVSMSCHLTTNEPQKSLVLARDLIKKKYGITHSTIQVELNKENKKQCKSSFH